VRTARVLGTYSGRQLAGGLPVDLPRSYSALVLSITPQPARSPAARAVQERPVR
jgi:hypothetical protein